MYALLFAGGFGQRLWPISRKNSPKQFTPILGGQSSLQLAVDRLKPIIPVENIYISTNERYAEFLLKQFTEIPEKNFIFEPTKRDLGAAVALSFFKLHNQGVRGPILMQWADNYIRNEDKLREAIRVGAELIKNNNDRIVFLGESPRFPSENLGYIELGTEGGQINGMPFYKFRSWHYRPKLDKCIEMVNSGNYLWNTGYFVTTVEFIVDQYRNLAKEITEIVEEIISYENSDEAKTKLKELYPTIPSMHFDEAFLMRLEPEHAILLKVNLGWSDPGNLYSMKEALQVSQDSNVIRGDVIAVDTTDSLILNDEEKTVSVMGLDGVMVINAHDVLLVIPKGSVRHIKTLLSELESKGKENLL